MEETILKQKKWKPDNQKIEDLAMKMAAQFFAEEMVPYFHIKGKIKQSAPTEHVYLRVKQMFEDFNYVMDDGSWSHFEFQSTYHGTVDMKRFREYEAVTGRTFDVPVITYVVFTGNIKNPMTSLSEGINTYRIIPIILKNQNADSVIQDIQEKMGRDKKLNRADLLPILFMPFMSGAVSQKERIKFGIKILKDEMKNGMLLEDVQRMQAVLYAFASKFLGSMDLEEIKEDIGMTVLGEMLVNDGIEKGKIQGKTEDILSFLREIGEVPTDLQSKIKEEKDLNLLSQWLKAAAKAKSMQDFAYYVAIRQSSKN